MVTENSTTPEETSQSQEDTQPYLQQKAELEAEERRKFKLEAQEKRHEIGFGGEMHELSAEGQSRVRARQEIRVEDPEKSRGISVVLP